MCLICIEGRLKYTTGQASEAVDLFLGLLRDSPVLPWAPQADEVDKTNDSLALDNFRDAFEVLTFLLLISNESRD